MLESQFSAMATRNQLGRESGRIEFSGTTRANRTRRRVSPETSGSQMSKVRGRATGYYSHSACEPFHETLPRG